MSKAFATSDPAQRPAGTFKLGFCYSPITSCARALVISIINGGFMHERYRLKHPKRLSGVEAFSLVELSIVLVILGLLTGGILSGQSLIRAAELRSIATEYQTIIAATNTFRDKYMAVPGDFRSATRFWGRMNSNADCVTNSAAAVLSAGTCDGTGNGAVSASGSAGGSTEHFHYWRQLALAGLIEGTYTGLAGPANYTDALPGQNVPASRFPNAAWGFYQAGAFSGDSAVYDMDYGHSYAFGGRVSGHTPYAAVLKPEEAWNVDTKLDDGRPAYGKVIARYWNNLCGTPVSGAATSANRNAVYNLSDTGTRCSFLIRSDP